MKRQIAIILCIASVFLSGCHQEKPDSDWELYCELKDSVGVFGVLDYLLKDISENEILEYLYYN